MRIPAYIVRWVIALLSLSHFYTFAAAEPTVNVIRAPGIPTQAALQITGLEEPMILMHSRDLKKWEELFLVTPVFNEQVIPHPSTQAVGQSFYRLKPLSSPIVFQADHTLGSPHLGRFTNYDDVELNIFGTRDEEGYPASITSISCRIGDKLTEIATFSTDGTNSSLQPRSLQSQSNDHVPVSSLSGYVIVDKESCNYPVPPVVHYKSRFVEGGTTLKQLDGKAQVEKAFELSDDTQTAYKYTVPWQYLEVFAPPPTENQRFKRGLGNALQTLTPDDPERALNAMIVAAGVGLGGLSAPATIPLWGVIMLDMLAMTQFGVAYWEGVNDDTPYDGISLTGVFTANEIELKAVIPSSDGEHYLFSSATDIESSPATSEMGPLLFIRPECQNRIIPRFEDPYISYVYQRASVADHRTTHWQMDEKILAAIEPEFKGPAISIPNVGFAAASLYTSVSARSIKLAGEAFCVQQIFNEVRTESFIHQWFVIEPTSEHPAGQEVEMRLDTSIPSPGVLSIRVGGGVPYYTPYGGYRYADSQPETFSLIVGVPYHIDFTMVVDAGVMESRSTRRSATLTLLGKRLR